MDSERPSYRTSARIAFSTYRRNQMTDNAASLTFFAMLSLFPALLAGVALLGVFGGERLATDAAEYVLENGADETTARALESALERITESNGKASLAFLGSILFAINGASGAFGAAGRALNKVHAAAEDRSFVRRKLTDILFTLLVIALFLVVLVAVFLGGGVARDLFSTIGLGSTAAAVWSVGRWFVALAAALIAYAVIYGFAPDVSVRRFRWITPGAVCGVLIWLVASALFAVYIKNFSSYGAAYGVFGAAIVLLLWLFITTNAFLFGAELNVAIERQETAGRGGPPMVSPPPGAEPAGRFVPTGPRTAGDPDPAQASGGPGRATGG